MAKPLFTSNNLLRQSDALFCIYPRTSQKYLFAISNLSVLTLSFSIKHGGPRSLPTRIVARVDGGEALKCSDGTCLTLRTVHGRVGRYEPSGRVPQMRTQSECVLSRIAPIVQGSRRRVVHPPGGPELAVSHYAREMLSAPYSALLRLGQSPPCLFYRVGEPTQVCSTDDSEGIAPGQVSLRDANG